MKKSVILCILAFLCLSAGAQDIDAIRRKLDVSRVRVNYSFVMQKVHCNGTITVQIPCFKASGNGIDVYSDGVTRWTVDPESKEVYIENAEGPDDYAKYLLDIEDLKLSDLVSTPISDDLSMFVFDVSKLDSSWVVTDLR